MEEGQVEQVRSTEAVGVVPFLPFGQVDQTVHV